MSATAGCVVIPANVSKSCLPEARAAIAGLTSQISQIDPSLPPAQQGDDCDDGGGVFAILRTDNPDSLLKAVETELRCRRSDTAEDHGIMCAKSGFEVTVVSDSGDPGYVNVTVPGVRD